MTVHSSIPVLQVSDYQRARAFWRDVLGFSVLSETAEPMKGHGIYAKDDAQVFLMARDEEREPQFGWRACVRTGDLKDLTARLSAAGQSYLGPFRSSFGLEEIEWTDQDGNILCFGQVAK